MNKLLVTTAILSILATSAMAANSSSQVRFGDIPSTSGKRESESEWRRRFENANPAERARMKAERKTQFQENHRSKFESDSSMRDNVGARLEERDERRLEDDPLKHDAPTAQDAATRNDAAVTPPPAPESTLPAAAAPDKLHTSTK